MIHPSSTLAAVGRLLLWAIPDDGLVQVAEGRDPKGLYKKARAGTLKNFTGIDDPYEAPLNPELVLRTHAKSVEECAEEAMEALRRAGVHIPVNPIGIQ